MIAMQAAPSAVVVKSDLQPLQAFKASTTYLSVIDVVGAFGKVTRHEETFVISDYEARGLSDVLPLEERRDYAATYHALRVAFNLSTYGHTVNSIIVLREDVGYLGTSRNVRKIYG